MAGRIDHRYLVFRSAPDGPGTCNAWESLLHTSWRLGESLIFTMYQKELS